MVSHWDLAHLSETQGPWTESSAGLGRERDGARAFHGGPWRGRPTRQQRGSHTPSTRTGQAGRCPRDGVRMWGPFVSRMRDKG
ncbi:hypothetical protein E2562_000131 [Oryza meyeriana var. granulata]|uniref:Uncharacterized protein n=1 Tax=Oryza meyeriana var. granulata TaxID=110450 RepID=A0A6G1DBY5_9ORYZ|nr:hypothetical protein E2562_000131 [Oryza meyeriana var. granulata]